jgi:hypothetical protein
MFQIRSSIQVSPIMLQDEQAQVNPDELLPNAHPDLTETPHKTVRQDGWMVERKLTKWRR